MALKPCTECKKEISTEAKTCPNCGKKNPTAAAKSSTTAIGCLVILVLVSLFSRIGGGGNNNDVTTQPPTPAPAPVPAKDPEVTAPPSADRPSLSSRSPQIARMHVKLDHTWRKGGFGIALITTFTFTNGNDVAIKDIEVECTEFGASGTELTSVSKTVYEVVPAHGKKVVPDFNMGRLDAQASSTSCQIKRLELSP